MQIQLTSYERMSTKARFEEEAKGNSEMAYCYDWLCHGHEKDGALYADLDFSNAEAE